MRGDRRWLPLSLALVATAAVWAARGPLGGAVRVGFRGDWRAVCAGFQRHAGGEALAGSGRSLVHFHGLDGRPALVQVEVQALPDAGNLVLSLHRDGQLLAAAEAGAEPRTLEARLPAGTREVDLAIAAAIPGEGAPRSRAFLLHAVRLARAGDTLASARSALPLLAGLGALALLWRRLRPPLATLWALLAVAGVTAALMVALDPVALLAWRPGWRGRAHVAGLALLAVATALSAGRWRAVAVLGVAAAGVALHLPTLHGGLVYDDFLWARAWSVRELASTFWGSEDPLGISNTNYRPLASVSHALDFLAWGFRPAGYHLSNLLLLAAAGALALRLLRALGAPVQAAAVGALALVAHPLAASSSAWISQRTDALAVGFGLLALAALVSPRGGQPLAVLPFVLASCWSKEIGVMLPAQGLLLVWVARSPGGLRSRRATLTAALALVVAYVGVWLTLFPEKASATAERSLDFGGFDPRRAADWLRTLPALYGPLLLPMDWQTWRRTPLGEPAPQAVAATLLGAVLLLWLWLRAGSDGLPARLVAAGLIWAPVALLPALGLRRIDLYRLGFAPAFGAALVAAGVACRLARRGPRLPAAFAAALILALAPFARTTAAAWGPAGFHYEAVLGFNRAKPEWLEALRPQAREQFERQWRARLHRQEVEALWSGAAEQRGRSAAETAASDPGPQPPAFPLARPVS